MRVLRVSWKKFARRGPFMININVKIVSARSRSKSFFFSVCWDRGTDSGLDQGLTNFYQAQTPNRQKEGYGPVGIVAVVIICEPF